MRGNFTSVRALWSSSLPLRVRIHPLTSYAPCSTLRFQRFSSHDGPAPHLPERSQHARRRRSRKSPKNENVTLAVNSLGEPGRIVVVPTKRSPRSKRQRKEASDAAVDDARPVTFQSMLNDLGEEMSPLTPDVIQKRIEILRDSNQSNHNMSASDWENLRTTLSSSFTYRQLSDYIEEFEAREHGSDESPKWRPGTSPFLNANPTLRTEVTERVASAQALEGKSLLSERILRDCWHLSIANEVGQLDLRLAPSFITLLLNSEHFSFDEVASIYGCSIDVTRSLGLVRLTGCRSACEPVHQIILDAASRIHKQEVGIDPHSKLSPGLAQVFSQAFLEWVGHTYGVAVTQEASDIPDKILYLAENKTGAANARRSLQLALYQNNPAPVPFSTYFPASEQANLYDYNPKMNTTWFNRQKPWLRWANPSRIMGSLQHETPFFDDHQTRLSDHLLKLLRDIPKAKSNATDGYGLQIHESVTAAVGRCLFSRKSPFEDPAISALQLGRLSLPRIFTTDITNTAPFLENIRPIKSEDGTQTYRLRLTPAAAHVDVAPELEIEAISRPGQPFEVQSVNVVFDTNSVDYLLPENGLDLRFTRTQHSIVSRENLESSDYQAFAESIKDSLRTSFGPQTMPSDSSSLPPFCQIILPRGLLRFSAHSTRATSSTMATEVPEGQLSVEYILPPLKDIQGAAIQQYNFDGRPLTFRYYESGPFLASHTTDVSLDIDISNGTSELKQDQPDNSLEQEFHSFYNTACRMAFELHRARHVQDEN
ncbi:hypothetical protein N7462_008345 [Penicillium macrosclerotiorum]|uniref:uncharacterized protein n=1 Tax=Penicillium macrosclerotiorum TaxID=303699 RepID=UPI0025493EC9|nr:uncharacterized protein N7462_008345 [Penicillium macrosclerotiorum]KAJ5675448.1 hypothetical protein N7462_008345 [Penicillium macrosclerotiorum]